ncbi:AMP-binding protein [Rhodobacterales bacterium HKCCE3408]|nr:AMP-binding protein [Rhodobacterales bacterium HKCCE3408]
MTDPDHTIGGAISAAAARWPDRVAVCDIDGCDITYADLDARTHAIAVAIDRLRPADGTGAAIGLLRTATPGVVAAFGGMRAASPVAIVSVKSGAAQIRRRAEAIAAFAVFHDADCAAEAQLLAADLGLPAIACDAIAPSPDAFDASAPDSDAIALLAGTSGSTGTPKLSCQSHVFLVENGAGINTQYGVRDGAERIAMLPPLGHHAAHSSLVRSVLCGATLHAVDLRRDAPDRVANWLRGAAVTMMHGTPTATRLLLDTMAPGEIFGDMRLVHMGGEAARLGDVRQVARHVPRNCDLFLMYGSTETGAIAYHRAPAATVAAGDALPPLTIFPGRSVEVLDADDRPLPPGKAGILQVGGLRLHAGYLDADPAGTTFRTADLGVIEPDGRLHHLGRAGSEVKIRGVRVDLGAIETHILGQPGIRDVAVVARPVAAGGDDRLVAFVQTDPDAFAGPAALGAALRRELSEEMWPARIEILPALPRTTTDKIDRKALRERELSALPIGDLARAHPELASIATLWAETLGVAPAEPDDDFFLSGGDSLLAATLAMALGREFGVMTETSFVYRCPTPEAQLAGLAGLPALAHGSSGDPVPATPAQTGILFRALRAGGEGSFNVRALIEAPAPLDPGKVADAVSGLIARHDSLRTPIRPGRGGFRLMPPADDLAPPEVPVITDEAAGWSGALAIDPGRPPLLRAAISRGEGRPDRLLLAAHHAAADGQSMDQLASECAALLSGTQDLPPPGRPHFRSVAAARPGETDDARLDALAESLSAFANAAGPQDNGPQRARTVSLHPSERPGFAALLGAFGQAVADATGREELLLVVPMGTRRMDPSRPRVGAYVNVVPVFLAVSRADDPQAAAAAALSEAMSRADLPFETVLRRMGGAPALDVTASLTHYVWHELLAGGFRRLAIDTPQLAASADWPEIVIREDAADGALTVRIEAGDRWLADEPVARALDVWLSGFGARQDGSPKS